LVGRLSEGTSQDTIKGAVLTAYTTPNGLGAMAQSLSYLPPASPTSRLIIQVPTVINVGEDFCLSPSLAPLGTALAVLPKTIVVLLSATPQESVDMASLSYKLTTSHVIHLFDHHSSAREVGHAIEPPLASSTTGLALPEAIRLAGYSFFDYAGDVNAHTVIVLLNGPLALVAKAFGSHIEGLGVVVVRVLRPWDESAFLAVLPSTVKYVHVLDDVPNAGTQGGLYADVLGSFLHQPNSGSTTYSHRIVPFQTQQYLSEPASFRRFIDTIVTTEPNPFDTSTIKKLVFFSTPNAPCSAIPYFIENVFLRDQEMSARLLTDYDVFSRADNIQVDRILLTTKRDQGVYISVPASVPLTQSSQGESDFLGILDHNLLKTHSLVKYAKPGSVVLVVTPWSVDEFTTNVPSGVLSLILERDLRICIIDAKHISSTLISASGPANDTMQNMIVHLAFLRLYLGDAATESILYKIAKITFSDAVQVIDLMKITSRAWAGLLEVELAEDDVTDIPGQSNLKEFKCNAIAVGTDDGDSAVSGARIGTWHDAARHLLFPSVFTPSNDSNSSEYPQNPALRPEIADRTFLVTCAVNRRLTPLEYDRNVFHLEFDSTGTGLKYAIGEALGVHGWNDETEVLDFCAWYGVDPARLITIPIMAGEGKMHTRTVLQALQQQIDLFGRPPKAFYTDLAAYATNPVDRHALLFIGSPEGAATFKKMAEMDTVTFSHVLKMYKSARPGIEILCEMVGDVKPRHYSIASAQSVVGDRVDLLVVTVDWVTPSGERLAAYIYKVC
jgi:sulfite reductase (NADPH) flavoprotein alpha-component